MTPDDVLEWEVVDAPFEDFRSLGYAGYMGISPSPELTQRYIEEGV